ncbi:hypothetical protein M413DRAFT_32733 [Hebeloma cylindrosporum]|uniref:Uncharacterized protein n=1 Tax=Hebeloma cylindrosporum TaxID=76867 RepID=A0A0C2Y209_HEBCY|nr:hypothetical protein M413DRAFT_32733 [Hebeloma cylindrosporum h7]
MAYFLHNLPFGQPKCHDIELNDMANRDDIELVNIQAPDGGSNIDGPRISGSCSALSLVSNTPPPPVSNKGSADTTLSQSHSDEMSVDSGARSTSGSSPPFEFSIPFPRWPAAAQPSYLCNPTSSASMPTTESDPVLPLLPPINLVPGKRRTRPSTNTEAANIVRVVERASRQAEEQLAQANQEAKEATKRAEELARRFEELSQTASEKLSAALDRAERAEQQAAAKSREAEEKFQNVVQVMEKKLADALEANRGKSVEMDVDDVEGEGGRAEDDSGDDGHNSEGAVRLFLLPRSPTAGSSITGTDVGEKHSIPRRSNTDLDDDEMDSNSDEEEIPAGQGVRATVPPPRKFPQTSGGSRSTAIHMNLRANNHIRFAELPSTAPASSSTPVNQAPSSGPPSPDQPAASSGPPFPDQSAASPGPSSMQVQLEPTSNSQHDRQQRRHSQKSREIPKPQAFGSGAQESRSSRPSSRRIYPQSKLRGFTTIRKNQLTAVRESMNRLMGIKYDKDVAGIDSATVEEIKEFEEGTLTVPAFMPMRPFLESSKRNSWNDTLCKMFIEHFEQEEGVDLSPEETETVEKMFLDRLSHLSRAWREAHIFNDSERLDRLNRSNKMARRNTRRLDLYHIRLEICYNNLEKRDGSIDQGWKATAKMIEELGPAGMSSDESEVDEETGRTIYRIRRRLWRAKVCKNHLLVVDSERNITNGIGGTRPGNQPRHRIRSSTATISNRAPTVGCPKNYYSKDWVANLSSERMIRGLKAKEAKDLGTAQGPS